MAMLSQSAIAKTWGPGCYRGPKLVITLNGGGKVTVRAAIGDAVLALDSVLRTYGYRTRARDTGALVCRDKVGHPGEKSNHSYGTALDLNWQSNPYGTRHTDMPPAMVAAICAIRTNSGAQVWNWGGYWSGTTDPMHFEIVCRPADIASGIRGRSVAQSPTPLPTTPATTPAPPAHHPDEEDEMRVISHNGDGNAQNRSLTIVIRGNTRFAVNGSAQLDDAIFEVRSHGGDVEYTNERGWQHYMRTTKV